MSEVIARLLSVALICTASTLGQSATAETRTNEIREIMDRALDEQHVLLTCTLFQDDLHLQLVRRWNDDLEQSQEVLREAGINLTDFEEYFALAQPDRLVLPLETPFGDVVAFCNEAGDWHRRFVVNFQLTVMHRAIAAALED